VDSRTPAVELELEHRAPRTPGLEGRGEAGQSIVFVVLSMFVLLGLCGFVIDVGRAYYTQRQLQSSADAAALAGAAQLPDPAAAASSAHRFGATPGSANAHANVPSVTESISAECDTSLSSCAPDNVVRVSETAKAPTSFLTLFGVRSISVTAKSAACGSCGSKPADVVLVFDRTLSMCMDFQGNDDPSCTKLENARSGMETFLDALDPALDRVGLVVLPPATSASKACTAPPLRVYDSKTAAWLLVPLTDVYKTSTGVLDHRSALVKTIDCLPAAGATAYADAIDQAQAELNRDGRPDVDHVIVFFTDGAANTGPSYYPKMSPYRQQPCHQGISSANAAKSQGTTVYAIGYTLAGMGGYANQCLAQDYDGPPEKPTITAYDALVAIASSSSTFFNQPSAGDLTSIFRAIGTQISGPRLIP